MQLFCENKIKIIFVSWTEYFNVEVLEVTLYNISNQIFSINLELIRPEKQYSLSNSNSFKCLKIQFPHHMMIPNLCNQHILCFIFCSLFENVKVFKKKSVIFQQQTKQPPLKKQNSISKKSSSHNKRCCS